MEPLADSPRMSFVTRLQGWVLDAIILIVVPLGLIAAANGWIDAIAATVRDINR